MDVDVNVDVNVDIGKRHGVGMKARRGQTSTTKQRAVLYQWKGTSS